MANTHKNAQFAHLFELFETLATRRTRATDAGEPLDKDDTHALSIPPDLQPVFRNLATLVTPRTGSGNATHRGRRNTVAVPSSSEHIDNDSDSESIAKFPLGKQYPFKFRMMLHKLYELEDWGRKVREVLERSQMEYKPLSEKENISERKVAMREYQLEDNETSRVHFPAESGANSPMKRAGRPRSHTIASSGGKGKEPQGARLHPEARDNERAVKKRCVGRKLSISGVDVGDKAVWVYEATVASSEINESRSSFNVEPVPPSVTRYGALQQHGPRKEVMIRRRVNSLMSVGSVIADRAPQVEARSREKRRSTSTVVVVKCC